MTVRINKPAINLREKLAELDKPSGLTGEELLRSQTSEEARNSLDLEEHLFENFESTGIDDNATSTKVTVSDSGVDVTGTVTADGLTIDNSGDAITLTNGDGLTQLGKLRGDVTDGFVIEGKANNNLTLRTKANTAGEGIKFQNTSGNNMMFIDGTTGDFHLYEDTGTTAKFVWDSSAEVLRINESTSIGLGDTTGDGVQLSGNDVRIKRTCTSSTQGLLHLNNIGTAGNVAEFYLDGVQKGAIGVASDAALTFVNGAGSSEAMRIDSSGRVGIGTASPSKRLSMTLSSPYDDGISVYNGFNTWQYKYGVGGQSAQYHDITYNGVVMERNYGSSIRAFYTNGSERARIDSSGNLLVGTTSTDLSTTSTNSGFMYDSPNKRLICARSNGTVSYFNRFGNDGHITEFRKDGSTVGSIGVAESGDRFYLSGKVRGVALDDSDDCFMPCGNTGVGNDGIVNLGKSNSKFKDLYLSGDANIEGKLGKSYSQTSTSGQTSIIDTGIYAHQLNGAIFDVYFKGNANSAGHYDYKSVGHYNVIITTDWNGSSVLHEITQVKLSFAGGGSGDNELVLTAVFWDGTNEHIATAADSNNEIRLKISGYSSTGTTGANQQVRITRRI